MSDPRWILPSNPQNPSSGPDPEQPTPARPNSVPNNGVDAPHDPATADSPSHEPLAPEHPPSDRASDPTLDDRLPAECSVIVQLLAAGDTVPEVADKLDKSPSTIKRLMREHGLRRESNDLRAARASKIAARLAAETDGAVDVLVDNLSHDNPVVQNSSATKLLDQALRFSQISSPDQDITRDYANEMVKIFQEAFSVFMELARNVMTDEQHQRFLRALADNEHIRQADELRDIVIAEWNRRRPL